MRRWPAWSRRTLAAHANYGTREPCNLVSSGPHVSLIVRYYRTLKISGGINISDKLNLLTCLLVSVEFNYYLTPPSLTNGKTHTIFEDFVGS